MRHELQERVLELETWRRYVPAAFPQSQLTPQPEFRPSPRIRENHRLPADYSQWLKLVGHGRLEEVGLNLYPEPRLGSEVMSDAHRHGLEGVVVIAEDDGGNYVIYNNRFERWYICFIVGEMRLVREPRKDLSFLQYMRDLCGDDAPGATTTAPPEDHQQWETFGTFLRNYSLALITIFIVAGALAYYLLVM